jgi:hypothetical protein
MPATREEYQALVTIQKPKFPVLQSNSAKKNRFSQMAAINEQSEAAEDEPWAPTTFIQKLFNR